MQIRLKSLLEVLFVEKKKILVKHKHGQDELQVGVEFKNDFLSIFDN